MEPSHEPVIPWRLRLHDASDAWGHHNRDDAWLWSPAIVAEYDHWAARKHPTLSELEADFLRASRSRPHTTPSTRARPLAAGLFVVGVVAASTVFVATHPRVRHASLTVSERRTDYYALVARARHHELVRERGHAIPLWIAAATLEPTLTGDLHAATDRVLAARSVEGWSDAVVELHRQAQWSETGTLVVSDAEYDPRTAQVLPSRGALPRPMANERLFEDVSDVAFQHDPTNPRAALLFDARTERTIGRFVHDEPVFGYDLTDDGRKLLLRGARHVSLWDTTTRRRIGLLAPHIPTDRGGHPVRPWRSQYIMPDARWAGRGARVVTLANDLGEIWDASTARRITIFSLGGAPESAMGYRAPDGDAIVVRIWPLDVTLIIGTERGEIRLRRTHEAGTERTELHVDDAGDPVFVSPNGSLLHYNWSGTVRAQWPTHDPDITDRRVRAFVAPDLRSLYEWAPGGIRVRGLRDGRRLALRRHREAPPYEHAALSPDGRRVLLATRQSIEVWDGALTAPQPETTQLIGSIGDAPFAPDGEQIVTAVDRRPVLWSLATGRPLATMDPAPAAIAEARFSPDGTRVLAIEAGRRRVFVWSVATRHLERVMGDGEEADVAYAALSSAGDALTLWTQEAPYDRTMPGGRAPLTTSLSVWNVATGAQQRATVGDLGERRVRYALPRFSEASASGFSAREVTELVAFGGRGNNVYTNVEVFDVRQGRAHVTLPAGVDRVRSSQFTRDLRRMVRVDADGVSLWDTDPSVEAASAVLLGQTNLRVCRGSLAVVPVAIPRPAALADSPYATDDECRAAALPAATR